MKKETIEKNTKLIRLVKMHPILYDHRHKYFFNSIKTQKKWNKIAEELNMPTSVCKRKWYSIRYHCMEYSNKGKQYYLANELEFLTQHWQILHYDYHAFSAEWSLMHFINYLQGSFVEYSRLTPENKLEVLKQSHLTLLDVHYKMKNQDESSKST